MKICEVEERMKALIMDKTANYAELMSLVNELQQQVASSSNCWR